MKLEKLRAALLVVNVQALGRACGVHPNIIYRIRNGQTNPTVGTCEKITATLNKKGFTNGKAAFAV